MIAPSKPSQLLGSFSFNPKIILAAILLPAFALRLTRLTFQPLWWDEGYSLFFATRDLGTLLDRTALDIHPPLYYAILQLWMYFAGTSDFVVRFLSVAMGVLTIPLIYALARQLLPRPLRDYSPRSEAEQGGWGERRGLLATVLFAIAPIEIYYSQEVRMYGLVTLLCLASTYFFVRLPNTRTRTLWFAYTLTSAAALYTQYYAAFILVFHFITVATVAVRKQSFRYTFYFLFPWLATALLYVPWVLYAGNKLYNYVTFKVGHEAYPIQDPISFLTQHLAAFSVGHLSTFSWLNWASILLILLAGLGIFARTSTASPRPRVSISPPLPHSPTPNLLISLYLFIPLILGYLVNLVYPFHPVRYERLFLLASPAFLLLIALGIAAIKQSLFRVTILAILAGISTLSLFDFYNMPRYPNDDYRSLIAQMQTLAQPGDNFLAIYPWQIGYIEAYYNGAPLNILETPNDAWTNNPAQMQRDVSALFAKNPRVWLPALQTLGRIVEDSLEAELRSKNYAVLDTWFGTTRLELFQRATDPPPSLRALRFEGSEMSSWGVSAQSVVSGRDVVTAWFDWGNIAQKKFSLRLVDAKGNIWAQDDRDVERGTQRVAIAIPAGTPPGTYDLRLALYDGVNSRSEAISIASIAVAPNDAPNLPALPHRAEHDFGNGMNLVGWDAGNAPLKPGFDSGITLFWQAPQKQTADYKVSIQLQDTSGKTWLDASGAIARGIYGSSQWRGNELVRDPRTFTVPGELPDGTYTLAVALLESNSNARIGNPVRLTQVQVKGRAHYFGVPSPTKKSDARIGEFAKLIGYDLVRSGRNLQVVLYWQAIGRGPIAQKVFVHVVDASGKIIAQSDQTPGDGEFPTTTWVKGEYLVDAYDLILPSDAVNFQIRIGMYDPSSNARLPVFDGAGNQIGDFVIMR